MGSDRGLQDYDPLTVSTDDDDLERSNLSESRDTVSTRMPSRCVVTLGEISTNWVKTKGVKDDIPILRLVMKKKPPQNECG